MKRCTVWSIHAGFIFALLGGAAAETSERLGPATRRTGLVISEMMYHPAPRPDGRNVEFIELYNSQDIFEDLSGYRFSGAVDFTFPRGTRLEAGEFLVIARVPADVESAYGIRDVLGGYSKGLNNNSGTVRLHHWTGAILLETDYSAGTPWPVAASGAGHSLVLARPSLGATDPRAWGASAVLGGSPGQAEPAQTDPLNGIVINEVLPNPAPGAPGFVELYNRGATTVDLSGAFLHQDPLLPQFVIPPGSLLAPGSFISFPLDTLNFQPQPGGGVIYLTNPERTRITDAVRFGAQLQGISWGRHPDGAERFNSLGSATPGAANAARWRHDVVINEIMYHPISRLDDDEYIELFNRGSSAVNLAGWQFVDGIEFTFPDASVIPAGGYLVVAKNAERLLTRYANLSSLNTVGDYRGALANSGERLALAMPDPLQPAHSVIVDEVTYADGGRWGRWSDGGGSSLELVDARSDNQLAANWADSDESAKAPWTHVEFTGLLDHGTGSPDQLQILLQGLGECLVDDVEVLSSSGVNLVPNSTFEGGASGWTTEGSQEFSSLETTEGHLSSQSYRVRAVARGDNQMNRLRIGLTRPLVPGQTATIRAKVRWLTGFPSVLFRLRGNYLEAVGSMSIPTHLGTPGAPNSRARPNLGPAIYDVTHTPILPAADQPVRITARIDDPDGLSAVQLRYRVDPSATLNTVPMVDDGTHGDAVAGDGIFTATIPGQAAGVLAAFHIQAVDGASAPLASTFPDDAPSRECLVRFGERPSQGTFGTYRLWMTQAVFARWTSRHKLSNTPLDVTFVYNDDRAIYNAQALFAGSPYISPGYNTPSGNLCGYTVRLPADDSLLGETDLVLDWPGRDDTAIQEQLSYWIAGQLGLPYNYRRFIHLQVNGVTGQQRGSIYEDVQQPGSEIIRQWVPDATGGDFYKIERWFEFSNSGQRIADPQPTLQDFTTTGGAKKLARYRWNWLKRATREVNDYTNIFRLVDVVNAPAPEPYTSQTDALVDTEQWMRTFATQHIINNFDSYGHVIGKNMYAYKPPVGKWLLFMFDIDWVMKESAGYGLGPSAPLFDVFDPTIARMYAHPPFRRAFFRAVQDAVNGPLLSANINPIMDAKFAALTANGVTRSAGRNLAPPTAVKQWVASRRAYLLSQLARVWAPFALTAGSAGELNTAESPLTLTGTAPVEVKTILVNGQPCPVTWTSVTNWSLLYSLDEGFNRLDVQALDLRGHPVPDTSATVHVNFTGQNPAAEVNVVINEWMASNTQTIADPLNHQFADWFELFNLNSTPADLSGFTLSDKLSNPARFVIPPGTIIPPNGFLLVWADDRPDQSTASELRVNFRLNKEGEAIGLFTPDGRVMDAVTFGPQTSDVSQGRWPDGGELLVFMHAPTPGAPNNVAAHPGEVRLLHVQVSPQGAVTLTWNAERGKSYWVQFTDSLDTPAWESIGAAIPATMAVATFTDLSSPNTPVRFYRVVTD